MNTSSKLLRLITVMAILISGFFVVRNFKPQENVWFPKCVFYQITGLHCPGCGATRSLHALANGNFYLAVRNNPLLILGGPVIAAAIIVQHKREREKGYTSARLAWVLLFLFILYFAARNLPTPTTSPFAPIP